MAKILEFPQQIQKMSPGYHNLTRQGGKRQCYANYCTRSIRENT